MFTDNILVSAQGKKAKRSQYKPNWYVLTLFTVYLSPGGGDLRHAEVGGADDIIVTGSVPEMKKFHKLLNRSAKPTGHTNLKVLCHRGEKWKEIEDNCHKLQEHVYSFFES